MLKHKSALFFLFINTPPLISICLMLVSSQIPKEWKARLKDSGVRTGRSIINHSVAAPDGTKKYLLQVGGFSTYTTSLYAMDI